MLTAVAIMFIIAGPFLLVANRYDIPAAPLLIFAGIIAGFFVDEVVAIELAQFGIALLVFAFGVSIEISTIRAVLADSEQAAIGQLLVVGSLGIVFGLVVGISLDEAVYLGVAAALSSTMIGTALVRSEIHKNLLHGRLTETIQFVQDLFAIGVLLVVGAGVFALEPIATQVGYGVFFLVGAVLINRYVFDVVASLAGGSDELMIVGVISLLVVFIGAAIAVGVSIVVGAFAAGLAVRYDRGAFLGLFNGLESIKDFFVAIFFVTIGALVVVPFLQLGIEESVQKLILAGGLVVITVVIKPAVTTAILIYRGYEARTATLTGLSTDQISEFSLIIAIQALLADFLSQAVFDAIILAAAVTMITSPLSQPYGERIYRTLSDRGIVSSRHDKIDALSRVPETISEHVIILGYDLEGQRIATIVEELGHPYVVIENDPALRETVRMHCDAYVFGDAMESYTWKAANANVARVVISMTDANIVSRRLLEFDFDATLILHAPDEENALKLLDAGASYVSVPSLLAGEQLTRYIKMVIDGGLSPSALREEGLATLDRLIGSGLD